LFINSGNLIMKQFSTFLSHLLPMRMLLSALLFITLFFASALPSMAARSAPDEGMVQLDEITQRSEAAADTPAMSLNPIDEPTEGGPNEVQGTADRDKMIRSKDTKLPVVKQAEKTLKK
jgi:hypothetical protein